MQVSMVLKENKLKTENHMIANKLKLTEVVGYNYKIIIYIYFHIYINYPCSTNEEKNIKFYSKMAYNLRAWLQDSKTTLFSSSRKL